MSYYIILRVTFGNCDVCHYQDALLLRTTVQLLSQRMIATEVHTLIL
jgi:hypothetical protein